jgi:peptide/nickel transport system substrate-binding protein
VRVHTGKAVLVGATALALAITGCSSSKSKGGGGGSSSSAGSGKLVYGESTVYTNNLMPLISAGNSTSTANLEIRTLAAAFRVTPQLQFQADPDQITAATSSMVNGQQVVDIKINPKAVWADGQPITSADYIFTAEAQKSTDPKKGGCASLLSETGFDQIESSKAVSDTEVQFTFIKGKPFPDWQSIFGGASGFVLSKHVFDQGDPVKNCAYITKGWPIAAGIPLGAQNGPWLLDKGNIDVTNKTFTLVHNPKYWGAAPKLKTLVYAYLGSDSDTNVKALQNQEVNMVYPQPQLDFVASLKQLTGITTEVNFGPTFEHLDFNTADPLLAHKEIRQAIAYAIDRKAMVAATVGKFSDKASVLGNRLLMTNQAGYQDHSGDYATQNIAKAKSLLEGIGCTMGSNKLYSCFGKPLSFKVMTTQDNPLRDQTIATLANQVKAAGIGLSEFANADIFAGTDKPTSLVSEGFQIALFAWVGTPAISSNAPIYLSPSAGGKGQNYTQAGTPAIDAALTEMSTAANTEAEIAAANKADSLLWEQLFTLPLYQKPTLLAYDSSFKGIGDNTSSSGPLWNSDTFSTS